MQRKIEAYVSLWMSRGYPLDIPDEVPLSLMSQRLAPSYKAICFAILKNDHPLESLGFAPPESRWYGAIKRIEIAARPKQYNPQRAFEWMR